MNTSNHKNPEELLQKFFDDELSPNEETMVLHMIADDAEMRSMLKFERFLGESLSKSEPDIQSFSVPDNFSDDVMSYIYQMEKDSVSEESVSYIDLLKQTVLSWFQPRQFSPAFVYALPVVLLSGFLFLINPLTDKEPVTGITSEMEFASAADSEERVWIRFVYIDESADQLAVAGNFSDWEPIEMDSQMMDGKRVWTGLVPVERGEHHYMFVKNGDEWVTDPLADVQRDDGFGNKNAVIYL